MKSTAAHEQGISHSKSKHSGIGVSTSGNIGFGVGSSKTERMTTVAVKNAPPEPNIIGWAFAVPFGVCFFGGIMLGFPFFGSLLFGLMLGTGAAIWLARLTKDEKEAERRRYLRQWYCRKCGFMFQV